LLHRNVPVQKAFIYIEDTRHGSDIDVA